MKPLSHRLIALLVLLFVSMFGTLSPAFGEARTVYTKHNNKDYTFTSVAIENLSKLRTTAEEMGAKQHLEVLQGIMMVETRAGTGGQVGLPKAHPNRRSYGLMQLTVPTARVVLRNNPDLRQEVFGDRPLSQINNKEIITMLLTNAEMNIRLGITLFLQYVEMVNNDVSRAIAGYNMGIGNALKRKYAPTVKYVKDVKSWKQPLQQLNIVLDTPVDIPEPTRETVVDQPKYKENDNGTTKEGSEANEGTECEQSCQQLGRTEEVQDDFSDYYALHEANR